MTYVFAREESHHKPGRFRCPRNDKKPRTGETRSNATLQQRLNGSRRTVPSTPVNSASTAAPSLPAPPSVPALAPAVTAGAPLSLLYFAAVREAKRPPAMIASGL
jgi:hypothetical protein